VKAGDQAIRSAQSLPNLFTRDERFFSGCLYRWDQLLGPIAVPDMSDENILFVQQACDTAGGTMIQLGNSSVGGILHTQQNSGGAASNVAHHRVKNRRFIDENHYLSLNFSIEVPLLPDAFAASTSLFVESQGVLKTKSR